MRAVKQTEAGMCGTAFHEGQGKKVGREVPIKAEGGVQDKLNLTKTYQYFGEMPTSRKPKHTHTHTHITTQSLIFP